MKEESRAVFKVVIDWNMLSYLGFYIERIIKRYKYKIATSDNLLVWNFPIFAICNLND